jgi:hypothetical protein
MSGTTVPETTVTKISQEMGNLTNLRKLDFQAKQYNGTV